MLKNIGLFCKRALQKRPVFCKETCIFKHPTHRSHPIAAKQGSSKCVQGIMQQQALINTNIHIRAVLVPMLIGKACQVKILLPSGAISLALACALLLSLVRAGSLALSLPLSLVRAGSLALSLPMYLSLSDHCSHSFALSLSRALCSLALLHSRWCARALFLSLAHSFSPSLSLPCVSRAHALSRTRTCALSLPRARALLHL